MSDTPKFEVIDRRKIKAEEEQDEPQAGRARDARREHQAVNRGGRAAPGGERG